MGKSNKKIPLVRAAFAQQFDVAMRACGVTPAAYYEKVGLPADNRNQPDRLLPERPFWKLINLVAHEESLADFGIRVAQLTPWHRVTSLAPLIHSSDDLGALLSRFCNIASSQSNTSAFYLNREAPDVVFGSSTETLYANDRQMELYRITSMIQLVQLAAGSKWRPERIDLQMKSFNSLPEHSLFQGSLLRFSQPNSQVHIPEILLKMPVNLDIPATAVNTQQYDIDLDFIGTLRQLIDIYAASGNCKIEFIAEVAGLSVRSLQRRLQASGLTFKQLLNEARHELARLKLQSTEKSITEVASILGYKDSAHFSRAFRSWSGVSPSQYRKSLDH